MKKHLIAIASTLATFLIFSDAAFANVCTETGIGSTKGEACKMAIDLADGECSPGTRTNKSCDQCSSKETTTSSHTDAIDKWTCVGYVTVSSPGK